MTYTFNLADVIGSNLGVTTLLATNKTNLFISYNVYNIYVVLDFSPDLPVLYYHDCVLSLSSFY